MAVECFKPLEKSMSRPILNMNSATMCEIIKFNTVQAAYKEICCLESFGFEAELVRMVQKKLK